MLFAYSKGLVLSLSLIVAIGSQNAFVLRQGILRHHVCPVVFLCAFGDAFLIISGVAGLPLLIGDFVVQIAPWLFGGAAMWLFGYGALRIRDVFGNDVLTIDNRPVGSIWASLGVTVALTFGNPHVYLDTVVLIGAVSLQFEATNKLYFGLGAAIASFVFFFSLVYGAKFLAPHMERPNAWRILDVGISVVMFALALSMLRAGGLI